ncbi:MAG: UDP-3-O-(3-hydroxymyristoyl)glucosamine N-acyltransferase [Gammaproteobacteria bacterium]
MFSLAELAQNTGAELDGDGGQLISGVASLQSAQSDEISFFSNRRYRPELARTAAAAVILAPSDRPLFAGACLLSANPYLTFARVSRLFNPPAVIEALQHPTASVDPTAILGNNLAIGAHVTVGANAIIGSNSILADGAVIGDEVNMGEGCRIGSRAVIGDRTLLGERCVIGEGAVLGSNGFGYANDGGRWLPVPQLGRVRLGDDVDVGANTTIDRGALADTVLERGVKLDNQIQVAHGVVIGEDTAIAACTGISGSTRIGKRCTIAGGVGFVGHLEIADDVHITGMSLVARSIPEPGVYSGYPAEPNDQWRKNTARFHKLDQLARRLVALERVINDSNNQGES